MNNGAFTTMRIAIIYSAKQQKLEHTARDLGRTLEKNGHRVEYVSINSQEHRLPNLRKYDYVYLGSVSEGTLGGKIPAEVLNYMKQCRGLESTKSAAFLLKRTLGRNNKSMKQLMAILEKMGSQVMDFQVISGKDDIEALAQRLQE